MVQELDRLVEFDPEDTEQIKWLIEHEDSFPLPVSGVNGDGDHTLVEVTQDCVIIETFQSNGWIRTNYYYSDGYVEEMFTR